MNLSIKKNGYVSPIVLLFILLFISVPIVYWFVTSRVSEEENVKGTADVAVVTDSGTNINIVSEHGTWDMFAYLCDNAESCDDNLTAGKRVGVFSGGKSDGFVVNVPIEDSWKQDHVVKLYIKAGWGSAGRDFKASAADIEVKSLSNDGSNYDIMLIPVSKAQGENRVIGTFSDE